MMDSPIIGIRNRFKDAKSLIRKSAVPKIQSSGFTLVELLVVLAIIAVITTISIPTIDAMTSPKHGLRKEGRKIMQLMTEARMASMSRKVKMELMIDPEAREIRMAESRVFRSVQGDDFLPSIADMNTNRYEKILMFDEEYVLECFTADQILTGDEEKDASIFESQEQFLSTPENPAGIRAVSFLHFGGSSGGGITLVKDDLRLHIAADILTGRPKVVSVGAGDAENRRGNAL